MPRASVGSPPGTPGIGLLKGAACAAKVSARMSASSKYGRRNVADPTTLACDGRSRGLPSAVVAPVTAVAEAAIATTMAKKAALRVRKRELTGLIGASTR
jgi:hypothetical protein